MTWATWRGRGRLSSGRWGSTSGSTARITPDVATDVNNLGLVLQDLGDLAGARTAYERALGIFEKFLPEGHPRILIVRRNLQALDESRTGSPG